jgi:phenylalanyl-tRNA synthetase beta chain
VVDVRERVRDTAVALGFYEVINYTLTDMRHLERVVDPADTLRLNPLGVVNPVAARYAYLRTSIRGSVLESVAANRNNIMGPLRLFEVGSEYLPAEADLPHERPVFCAVLGGAREARWPGAAGDPLDFFDAKGALEAVLAELGVAFKLQSATHFGLLEGHTAGIFAGKDPVGIVAQVAPSVAAAFDIDQPVFLVELWLEDLARHVPARPAYTPISRHPAARVDLAVLVDESTPAGAVLDLVRSHRSREVTVTADVFDEYRGKGIPLGKKSLALNVRFQSGERTLDEKDVARVRESLLARLDKELGATLRGA